MAGLHSGYPICMERVRVVKNRGLFQRVLGFLSGVLLIIAGVLSIWNPQAMARFLTALFGVVLLFSGLLDVVVFLKCRRAVIGAGWILVDGILTMLMALFLLCNQWLAGLAVPVIFSMWILFSGISSVVRSLDLKSFRVRGWGWFLFLGLLQTGIGILLFIQPVVASLAVGVLIGTVLIVQGLAAILSGLFSRRLLS